MNVGENVDYINIDLSKAFDVMSYFKLLFKISAYGFSQLTINWLH